MLMLKVGITGGIGSGKSVVCRVFATLGIPVFDADAAARHLMANDPALKQAVINLLGPASYESGLPNRPYISSLVFNDPDLLRRLNGLVHPATIQYANDWMAGQTTSYSIKEAAIFFESGSHKEMDIMVGVFAPVELRIYRAGSRSNISRQKVLDIMASQMDEDAKMKLCNHVIINDDHTALIPQVLQLHQLFLSLAIAAK